MSRELPVKTRDGLPATGWCLDCGNVAVDAYDEGYCRNCRVERKFVSASMGVSHLTDRGCSR
jgi:hypothetical protein